jgi:hypothetical protein
MIKMSECIFDVKLTHAGPDSDGDLSYAMQCGVRNPTEDIVEFIWCRTDMFDQQGLPVHSCEEYTEDYLEPGEETSVKLNPGYFNQSLIRETPENVRASLTMALCTAEVLEYPALDLPDGYNNNHVPIEKDLPIKVGQSLDISGLSVWVNKPDEDGEVNISTRVVLTNKTSHHIYKCQTKARVIGANGREIAESIDESEVPFEGSTFVWSDIWNNLKPSQLGGARIHFIFTVFSVVSVCKMEKDGSVLGS